MSTDMLLPIVGRWLHIVSAILLVGGLTFTGFVALPGLGDRESEVRASIRSRWARVVMITSGFLLLSGIYNFVTIGVPKGRDVPVYHMLFGVKFLLALGVMFFASALSGRSQAFEGLRNRSARWYVFSALAAIAVVLLSGVMKNLG